MTIAPQDAVLHRLTKALAYLAQTYPNEGWGAFLVNGAPDWSRIVLGGHSNGSGEAAFIELFPRGDGEPSLDILSGA